MVEPTLGFTVFYVRFLSRQTGFVCFKTVSALLFGVALTFIIQPPHQQSAIDTSKGERSETSVLTLVSE